MMFKKSLFPFVFLAWFISAAGASSLPDEGMWLPLHIKRLAQADLQKMGLRLSPDEIYGINNASLKDAIVSLGGFCTGEIVSKDGLMLTNHHCAFEAIQSHSSTANDYVTNGFWAKTKSDELPNQGLTASFLVRMEDVSARVLAKLNPSMGEQERLAAIAQVSAQIRKEAQEGTHYKSEVKSFYNGNEFYLFVYEVFEDVRLVGAPPSSIGKFGGDTDNWMWPRHTGDFSLFRVYAGKDGKPAPYSKENIPLKPKYFLPISLSGVKPSDFVMVFGFPGSTDRYLSSYGVSLALDITNPNRVKLRETKLNIMKADMDANDSVRLKYVAKYAQISNYWKYFIGQSEGLKKLNVMQQKQQEEARFVQWANATPERKSRYGSVLDSIALAYQRLRAYKLSEVYIQEAAFGPEINQLALQFRVFPQIKQKGDVSKDIVAAITEELKQTVAEHFKNYYLPTDKKLFAAMLRLYKQDVPKDQQPNLFSTIDKKYKGDFNKYADYVFAKTIFNSKAKTLAFIDKPDTKLLEKDPAYQTIMALYANYKERIQKSVGSINLGLQRANRLYLEGQMKMQENKLFYPDANSTMRFTYGTVQGYNPRDAVHYKYYTTLAGVMEKRDPTNKNEEFIVPNKLAQLYESRDYGRYSKDSVLNVGFISNNDITGGNSGSPVINGDGHLVGIAFDGNWEAMSGDIAFEHKLQRTISVDIRYVLFVIDKYAGASHLVDEMTLVSSPQPETPKPEPSKPLLPHIKDRKPISQPQRVK